MASPDWRLLRITLRTLAFGLLWGLLWAWGYSPADYPVRLAVRAFGHPVATLRSGNDYQGGIVTVRTMTESGDAIKDITSSSARKVRGGKQFVALDVPGFGPVYRLAVGFPFGTLDLCVTAALAFLLFWMCFPKVLGKIWKFSREFLGKERAPPRNRAIRIPLWVLTAADIAALSCVILGPFIYSAAQVCVMAAIWFALRFAGFKGYVEFIELLPPASEPSRLSLPGSENAPVRGVQRPQRKPWPFLAHTTPEGWSRLPSGAVAVGLLILAVVQTQNRLVSVPEPGYRIFGLSLPLWQAVGWGLLVFAAFVATWEFFSAWRRTDNA